MSRVGEHKIVTLVDPDTPGSNGAMAFRWRFVDPLYFDASGNRIRGS